MINLPANGRNLVIIGLTAYLLFAVITFPATLAISWFAPDEIRTASVSGTVWSGHANTIVTPDLTLDDTDWHARPLSLLTAKLSYRLNTRVSGGAIDTVATFSPGGTVRLTNLSGVLPLSALPGMPAMVTIEGRMGLDLDQLLIEDQWPTDATGTIDIVGLKVISPVAETLGSFTVVFAGPDENGSLQGKISQVDGPLAVDGTLLLASDKKWQLAGTVRPLAAASDQLTQGLAFLGSRNADGSYNLAYPSQ